MDILLATNNSHKAAEFRRIFASQAAPHNIILPDDVGLSFSYEEGTDDYLTNSMGKARALYEQARRPVLADDSGLAVAALGWKPGVFSSRFGSDAAGKLLSPDARNRYLLDRMSGLRERRACFVCCMVLLLDGFRFLAAQETLWGEIARRPRGKGGFGYDPVFWVAEHAKTVAELADSVKDSISHRGKAAMRILAMIEKTVL
jgi:XTP/dITP diphosphohydrolase